MEVQHDAAKHKFYITLPDGQEALLQYHEERGVIDLYHTYVPPQVRERGLAEKVVEAGFRYAEKQNLKVIPSCSYVSSVFLKKRKEFLPLVKI